MATDVSNLQKARSAYQPKLPKALLQHLDPSVFLQPKSPLVEAAEFRIETVQESSFGHLNRCVAQVIG